MCNAERVRNLLFLHFFVIIIIENKEEVKRCFGVYINTQVQVESVILE